MAFSTSRPISETGQVTDEVILLFFRIEPLTVDINTHVITQSIDYTKTIANAEKAFIKVLNTSYNTIKFNSYSKGSDGLYEEGIDRYGYLLGENSTLKTDTATFVGKQSDSVPNSDMILIEGDKVDLVIRNGN